MGESEKALSTRPKSIAYKIELPGVSSVSDLDLDVSDSKLVMTSSVCPGRVTFLLEVFLPYPCEGTSSKAKWDKDKKVLTVTIPVRPPSKQELQEMQKARLLTVVSSVVVDDDDNAAAAAAADGERDGEVDEVAAKVTKMAVTAAPPAKAKAHVSTREAFATDQPILINNKESEFYTLDGVQKEQQEEGGKQTQKQTDEVKKEDVPIPIVGEYFACSKYEGSKLGFVFKTGKDGLGYYKDVKAGGGGAAGASARTAAAVADTAEKVAKSPVPYAPLAPKAAGKSEQQQFYPNDSFDFRQSPKTVSILVHVANVDGESVKADFKGSSLRVEFSAGDTGKPHEFCLELAHEIVPSECKFDVSTKNMVLVLQKKDVDMAWITLEKVAGNMTAGAGNGTTAAATAAKTTTTTTTEKEKGGSGKSSKAGQAAGVGAGASTVYNPVSETSSKLMFSLD